MTVKEMAEKIIQMSDSYCRNGDITPFRSNLESLLSSALEEAQKQCIGLQVEECARHVKEAYEDAAKIAESLFPTLQEQTPNTPQVIAQAIRAKAAEVGK